MASGQDLALHGFPPLPEDPELLAHHQRLFTRLKGRSRYIAPTFSPRSSVTKRGGGIIRTTPGPGADPGWTDLVVYAPNGQSFAWVYAEWIVPNVSMSMPSDGGTCASWVGMDDANLLQAGADSAFNSDGTTTFSVWFEWIPNNPFTIDSLLINPGDLIAVLIRTAGAGSTTAAIYIIDVTIGCFTSFEIDAPRDTNFGAGTAEWIVEAPSTLALPDYGQVFFSNAVAGLA
jgi:hypothetical protein